jgi:uncharacterized protein
MRSAPGRATPTRWLADPARARRCAALRDLAELGRLAAPARRASAARAELPPMPFPLATLVLNVTNKCNLSCTYCYEYGEDRLRPAGDGSARLASRDVDDTARSRSTSCCAAAATAAGVDHVLRRRDAAELPGDPRRGEPRRERGRVHRKRVHYSLTTNATLLTDEVVDFLTAHRFGITISIDGDQQEQDRHRTFRSGKGSFDVIAPRIRTCVARTRRAKRPPIGARVTLTAAPPTARDLPLPHHELGFDEVGFAPVTAGPVALRARRARLRTLLREFGELGRGLRRSGAARSNARLRQPRRPAARTAPGRQQGAPVRRRARPARRVDRR